MVLLIYYEEMSPLIHINCQSIRCNPYIFTEIASSFDRYLY